MPDSLSVTVLEILAALDRNDPPELIGEMIAHAYLPGSETIGDAYSGNVERLQAAQGLILQWLDTGTKLFQALRTIVEAAGPETPLSSAIASLVVPLQEVVQAGGPHTSMEDLLAAVQAGGTVSAMHGSWVPRGEA